MSVQQPADDKRLSQNAAQIPELQPAHAINPQIAQGLQTHCRRLSLQVVQWQSPLLGK